jgi:hypothetical protein
MQAAVVNVRSAVDQLRSVAKETFKVTEAISDVKQASEKVAEEMQGTVDDVARAIPEMNAVMTTFRSSDAAMVSLNGLPLVGNTITLLKSEMHSTSQASLKKINSRLQFSIKARIKNMTEQLELLITSLVLLEEIVNAHIDKYPAWIQDILKLKNTLQRVVKDANLNDIITMNPRQLEIRMQVMRETLDHAINKIIDYSYHVHDMIEGVSRSKQTISYLGKANMLFWWLQHSDGVSQMLTARAQYLLAKKPSTMMLSGDTSFFESSLRSAQRVVWALGAIDLISGLVIAIRSLQQTKSGILQVKSLINEGLANELAKMIRAVLPENSEWSKESKVVRARIYRELRILLIGSERATSALESAIQNTIINLLEKFTHNAAYNVSSPVASAISQVVIMLSMPVTDYRQQLSSDTPINTTYLVPGLYRSLTEATGFREYTAPQDAASSYLFESQMLTPLLYWTEMSIYKNILSGFFATMTAKYAVYKARSELNKLVENGELIKIVRNTLDSVLKSVLFNAEEMAEVNIDAPFNDGMLREVIPLLVNNVSGILIRKNKHINQIVQEPKPLNKIHQLYGKVIDPIATSAGHLFSLFSHRTNVGSRDERVAPDASRRLK